MHDTENLYLCPNCNHNCQEESCHIYLGELPGESSEVTCDCKCVWLIKDALNAK